MGVENISMKPHGVVWGNQNLSKVTCVADVADSLDGTYFTFDTTTVSYYVWMDGVAASDPAPAGQTAVPIAYSTGATAATLQALIVTAIDALGTANAKVDPDDSDSFYIQNTAAGTCTATADVDTGFTVATTLTGSSDDLGCLEGDIESTFEELTVDVMCHHTGAQPVNTFRNGKNVELTVNLLETDIASLKKIFGSAAGGDEVTPAGGTEVFGWGEDKRFTSVLDQARKLVLHPSAKAAADLTEDISFWSAYPVPSSIVMSGETPSSVSVTFRMFPLDKIDDKVNFFVMGDSTQNLLK